MLLSSCNNAPKKEVPENQIVEKKQASEEEKKSFFPVTSFIKGQLVEIKQKGINPLKITTRNNKQDSVWLKHENLGDEFSVFLTPVIDSTNLTGLFNENKFLDQTINAYTFTYDPLKLLPDSILLQRWDIYIDPESNTVKRIYIVRKTIDHKILQLTWQANKSCKIVTIATDKNGKDYVEKETAIKWDF